MLLSVSLPLLLGMIAVLVVQWGLAVFALSKLFLLRPKLWVSIVLNVAVVLLVIVGPVVFLVWFYASGKDKLVRERLDKLVLERKLAAEKTEETETEEQLTFGLGDGRAESDDKDKEE